MSRYFKTRLLISGPGSGRGGLLNPAMFVYLESGIRNAAHSSISLGWKDCQKEIIVPAFSLDILFEPLIFPVMDEFTADRLR